MTVCGADAIRVGVFVNPSIHQLLSHTVCFGMTHCQRCKPDLVGIRLARLRSFLKGRMSSVTSAKILVKGTFIDIFVEHALTLMEWHEHFAKEQSYEGFIVRD